MALYWISFQEKDFERDGKCDFKDAMDLKGTLTVIYRVIQEVAPKSSNVLPCLVFTARGHNRDVY